MNAPFQPDPIAPILANVGVSFADLGRDPAAAIDAARERQVAIIDGNRPVAYIVAPHVWENLCDLVADQRLMDDAHEALADLERGDAETVEIDLDQYL